MVLSTLATPPPQKQKQMHSLDYLQPLFLLSIIVTFIYWVYNYLTNLINATRFQLQFPILNQYLKYCSASDCFNLYRTKIIDEASSVFADFVASDFNLCLKDVYNYCPLRKVKATVKLCFEDAVELQNGLYSDGIDYDNLKLNNYYINDDSKFTVKYQTFIWLVLLGLPCLFYLARFVIGKVVEALRERNEIESATNAVIKEVMKMTQQPNRERDPDCTKLTKITETVERQ